MLEPIMPPKVLKIIEYPSPILEEVCQPITEITDQFKRLARDMIFTLWSSKDGVGLAAPQVGVPARLIVVSPPGKPAYALFNPTVRRYAPSYVTKQEGCLSFPGVVVNKRRPKWVAITYTDISGKRVLHKAHGLEATVILHELDHLEGRLFK